MLIYVDNSQLNYEQKYLNFITKAFLLSVLTLKRYFFGNFIVRPMRVSIRNQIDVHNVGQQLISWRQLVVEEVSTVRTERLNINA